MEAIAAIAPSTTAINLTGTNFGQSLTCNAGNNVLAPLRQLRLLPRQLRPGQRDQMRSSFGFLIGAVSDPDNDLSRIDFSLGMTLRLSKCCGQVGTSPISRARSARSIMPRWGHNQ